MENVQQSSTPGAPPTRLRISLLRILALLVFAILIAALSSLGALLVVNNQSGEKKPQPYQQTEVSPPVLTPTPILTNEKAGDNLNSSQDESTIVTQKISSIYERYSHGGYREFMSGSDYTENFRTELGKDKRYDQVLCTQGGSDEPIRVDNAIIQDNRAQVIVRQKYINGDNIIKVELLKSGNNWQIDKVTCSF